MFTRMLGGMAVCLGATGWLVAQQPRALPAPLPESPPPVVTSTSPAAIYPALNPIPRRMPRARLMALRQDRTQSAVPAQAPAPVQVQPKPMGQAPNTLPGMQPMANGTASNLLTSVPSYADCACPPEGCALTCDPCGPCGPCGPAGRFWVDAGWIFWTTKGQNLPALVTAAPAGTPRDVAGVIGQPNTTVLYGNNTVNDQWRSGFYLNTGLWFDECNTCGIEGNFFFLGEQRDSFTAACPPGVSPTRVVTRPFTNGLTGQGDTQLVCFPDVLTGSITVDTNTEVIGGGVNFVKNLCCGPCGRFDLLLGYQYFHLGDEVNITESNLTALNDVFRPDGTLVVPQGTQFTVKDRFRTQNDFHGGTIGFATERRFGDRWYFGLRSTVALGSVRQNVRIDGSTVVQPVNAPAETYVGGLLTQPSNIGNYTQNKFAVMPTVGVKLGAQITENIRTYVGYDFMYISSVVRAADQIDLRVNPTQIPPRTNVTTGPALPAFTPNTSDFWMQGIRVGVEVRF